MPRTTTPAAATGLPADSPPDHHAIILALEEARDSLLAAQDLNRSMSKFDALRQHGDPDARACITLAGYQESDLQNAEQKLGEAHKAVQHLITRQFAATSATTVVPEARVSESRAPAHADRDARHAAAFRDLEVRVADLRNMMFVFETVVDGVFDEPTGREVGNTVARKMPEFAEFRIHMLNEDQEGAFCYARHELGDLVRSLYTTYYAGFGGT